MRLFFATIAISLFLVALLMRTTQRIWKNITLRIVIRRQLNAPGVISRFTTSGPLLITPTLLSRLCFAKFEQAINDLSAGTIGTFCVRCHQQVGTQRGGGA